MRIYGPYLRKDGRKHIVILNDEGTRTTKSYPRYLLEQHLGRELTEEETVDHIDEDFTNDAIDNLQLLSLVENVKKARLKTPKQMTKFTCPNCSNETTKSANQVRHGRNQGKRGPFCSRKCAGKATYVNPWTHKE